MRACVVLVAVSGCGLGWVGTADDPSAGLPTSGAGPYARLEIDDATPALEPQVISDRNADLYDPSALAGDGTRLRVWFSRAEGNDPTVAQIYYAEAASAHDIPDVAPTLALAADQAWEDGRVSAPSVIEDAAGLAMYYQGGATAAIGVAHSVDAGATWAKDPGPIVTGAEAPSAVIVDGETWLFVTRPGMPGIWRAVNAGAGWSFDPAPVIEARPGVAKAFDRLTVGDPVALAVPLRDGGIRIHLWFTGTTDDPADMPAVGYASTFDGGSWDRFGGIKPMLAASATGPTVLLTASRGLMLFAERNRGHLAITVAEHP